MNKRNNLKNPFNGKEEKSRKKIELFLFIALGTIFLLFLVHMFFGENIERGGGISSGRWKFEYSANEGVPIKINEEPDLLLLKVLIELLITLSIVTRLPLLIFAWLCIKCYDFFRISPK